jgi:hypothetical protein
VAIVPERALKNNRRVGIGNFTKQANIVFNINLCYHHPGGKQPYAKNENS